MSEITNELKFRGGPVVIGLPLAVFIVITVAMITAGPLTNVLRKRHKISAYRSANLLDTISCSFPYILPYSATVVTALAIQRTLAAKYSFVVVTGWLEMSSMFFTD